jgi:threonylcarbamoyladenosine tRNA methylthiotransferase MtaB
MKVHLSSIGCRLNQSEIETMGRQLLANGHEIVADPTQADQVIINTCAVTREAARDARSQTRRLHRDNPDAAIYLTGCYATIAASELQNLPGTPQVIPNSAKMQLVRRLDPRADLQLPIYDQEPVLREFLAGQMGNTRAFVKVQDGCNNRCTFCVTTVARGESASRHLGDIVAEIQALAAAGYQEAVLTGVHLGSYGRDLDHQIALGDLVTAILRHTDIPRLRLSSLEPWDLEPEFFDLWQDPRLLPHLHMPLQSGSDAVLRRMARRTSRSSYRQLIAEARARIPNLNVSSDIILGFPGETAADFEQSLEYVREIGFARLHAFTYSSRPGTAAAKMSGQIAKQVKKERTRQMIALGEELSRLFYEENRGSVRPVLWEQAIGADNGGLRWSGYTDNYIRVVANGPQNLFNTVTPTILLAVQGDGVAGEVQGISGG